MQIIRGNSAKNLFLIIFTVILCTYPLYTKSEIRTFSYNEEKDYGPTAIPRVWDSKVFDNGTMVIRIVRRDLFANPSPNYICFINMFSLRIINLDGTVIEKDFNLNIPTLNYCAYQNGSLIEDFMKYDLIRKNQILVTYYDATNLDDINTYTEWGIVIDFDGNILSRIAFGPAFIDNETQRILPKDSKIQFNINREKGFLRYNRKKDDVEIIEWQQYRIEPEGVFTKLTAGNIAISNFHDHTIESVSTVDEGYAIVFVNITNYFNATNPFLPQGQLFILPIGYNQTSVPPFLLYQTSVPNIIFTDLVCKIEYGGSCILIVAQRDPTGTLPVNYFYIKVDFLFPGSVISSQIISRELPSGAINWEIHSLTFGGYFLTSTSSIANNKFMHGFYLDRYSVNPINWEFSEPMLTNLMGIFEILPHNNTLLVAQNEIDNSWHFLVTDFPKFDNNRDNGYYNLNVNSTIPAIRSTVSPDLDTITINFYDPVYLSTGKLSIYMIDGDKTYLRQTLQADSFSGRNNGRTIIGRILSSTFSLSKRNYFIKMENNFVRNQTYGEPMLGIRENIWIFTTEERKDQFSPSTSGSLFLTLDGTLYYKSLSSDLRYEFIDKLLNELSYAIPIARSRLSSSYGKATIGNQYSIHIDIIETRIENDISVKTVIDILNIMIRNKDQTPIGEGQTTKYLDERYGFLPSRNFWEKYKLRLLGIFLISFGLLIILFIFGRIRDSNGNNIVILQLGIIIFDLVVDILFILYNANNIPILYLPSVFFLVIPVIINAIFAFYIVTKENTNTKFNQWFKTNGKVAFLFTILAGADIKVLEILHSKFAGFSYFKAPFSKSLKEKILWGSCLSIFIGDIPQVAIQICYMNATISLDIIPFLTLVSSALNLTINIVSRLYHVTNRVINQNASNYIYDSTDSDDSDYFDDLNTVVLPNSKKKIKKK